LIHDFVDMPLGDEARGLFLEVPARVLIQAHQSQENVARIPATTTPRFRPGEDEESVGARRASRRCSM